MIVDGVTYDVFAQAESIRRAFAFLEGPNADRALAGNEILDTIGTMYSYTLTIEPNQMNAADYDALYQVLSSPDRVHTVTLPYGRNGRTITFDAKIESGTDSLDWKSRTWRHLDVTFTPIAPQRT